MPPPTARACDRCRIKKTKCDRQSDATCSACVHAKLSCTFDLEVSKRSSTTAYTEALEQRNRLLDTRVAGLLAELERTRYQISHVGQTNTSPTPPATGTDHNGTTTSRMPPSRISGVDNQRLGASHLAVSREFGRMVEVAGDEARWHGNSSGIYFLDAALVSVQASLEKHLNLGRDIFGALQARTASSPSSSDESYDTALPPIQLAMDFTSLYFDYLNQMIPVLHKGTFLGTLTSLYEGKTDVIPKSYLPLFYHVMTIGRHLERVVDPMNAADHWNATHRSQDADKSYPGDMETLQLYVVEMLVMCMEKDPWNALQLCGQATRLALSLGLHRHSQRFQKGPLETEMRKRVFWSVMTLDTWLSALFGLPKSLHTADIDVDYPAEINDEHLTSLGYFPALPGKNQKMAMFSALCRLTQLQSTIIEKIYSTTDRSDMYHRIVELRKEHNRWSVISEPCLELHEGSYSETYFRLQLILLSAYTSMLINRPMLSVPTDQPEYAEALELCSEAALTLVSTASKAGNLINILRANPGANFATTAMAILILLLKFFRTRETDEEGRQTESIGPQIQEACSQFTWLYQNLGSAWTSWASLPVPDLTVAIQESLNCWSDFQGTTTTTNF